ncbi:hypothetical protein GCM10023238_22680 [Streptomyces heliomycini]
MAFGFDTAPRPSEPGNFFVSPPPPLAQTDARWCCGYAAVANERPGGVPPLVAERGEELYAYTLRGTDVDARPGARGPRPGEVLTASTTRTASGACWPPCRTSLGLSLPRHALAEASCRT